MPASSWGPAESLPAESPRHILGVLGPSTSGQAAAAAALTEGAKAVAPTSCMTLLRDKSEFMD